MLKLLWTVLRKAVAYLWRQVRTFEPSPMTQTYICCLVVALQTLQSIWSFLSLRVLVMLWHAASCPVLSGVLQAGMLSCLWEMKSQQSFGDFRLSHWELITLFWSSTGHKATCWHRPCEIREKDVLILEHRSSFSVCKKFLSGQISTIKRKNYHSKRMSMAVLNH